MSKKQATADPIAIRSALIDAVKIAPTQFFTRALLVQAVADLLPSVEVRESDILPAIQWHKEKGNITNVYSEKLEQDLWRVTERGKSA